MAEVGVSEHAMRIRIDVEGTAVMATLVGNDHVSASAHHFGTTTLRDAVCVRPSVMAIGSADLRSASR